MDAQVAVHNAKICSAAVEDEGILLWFGQPKRKKENTEKWTKKIEKGKTNGLQSWRYPI